MSKRINFNILTLLFLPSYLLYYRCYLGFSVILILQLLIALISCFISYITTLIILFIVCIIHAWFGEAITGYFQERKRQHLIKQGCTDNDLNILLAPNWEPVIMYIGSSLIMCVPSTIILLWLF